MSGFRLEQMDICIEDACDIASFWWKMKKHNLVDRVFFNGGMKDAAGLFMLWKSCWVYMGYQDDKMVGAIWFNRFATHACNIHICSFPGYIADSAHDEIESLLQRVLDNSTNSAYRILGETPYKGIVRQYKQFGFKDAGYCYENTEDAVADRNRRYIAVRYK